MNLPPLVTDNITEVLVKIIEFTQTRQRILTQNINAIHSAGFVPKDLAVDEFSILLNDALIEHVRNKRLMLRDTENIKFGVDGSFEVRPVMDETAKELFNNDRDKYLEFQIDKLLENSLNQRVAAELLKQKNETVSILE